MANGTLGQSLLTAATYTTVYTVPASAFATVNINFCSTNTIQDATVRLAIAANATPVGGEFIEYEAYLPATPQPGVLERAGIVLSPGKRIVAYCGVSGMNVNVFGFEQSLT
jgi:hypothetical protein